MNTKEQTETNRITGDTNRPRNYYLKLLVLRVVNQLLVLRLANPLLVLRLVNQLLVLRRLTASSSVGPDPAPMPSFKASQYLKTDKNNKTSNKPETIQTNCSNTTLPRNYHLNRCHPPRRSCPCKQQNTHIALHIHCSVGPDMNATRFDHSADHDQPSIQPQRRLQAAIDIAAAVTTRSHR